MSVKSRTSRGLTLVDLYRAATGDDTAADALVALWEAERGMSRGEIGAEEYDGIAAAVEAAHPLSDSPIEEVRRARTPRRR